MRIDSVKRDDLPALADIWNRCFPCAGFSSASLEEQIYSKFKLDENGIFCLREKSAVKGFSIATTVQIPFTGEGLLPGCVPVIALEKSIRGKDAGAALLKNAEEYLAASGSAQIRIGYPTYLRGTVLSHIGVNTRDHAAVDFFQKSGYAPKKAIDSMVFQFSDKKTPPEIKPGGEKGVVFEALKPKEEAGFLSFIKNEFPGSWHKQFLRLSDLSLLECREVLVMKQAGKISGFAGPFNISECGDTCGIGLGVAENLRGKGFGLTLLYGIRNFIMENGGKKITLFGAVDKINYYGKAGFIPGHVYLVMEKNLERLPGKSA